VFNGDLTMPQGSSVNGDVFVTNGDAEIAGRVNGDLAVISGDLELSPSGWVEGDVFGMSGDQEIAGRVSENLALMLGSLKLQSSAVVGGDVTVISGSYERQAGAQVLGEEVPNVPLPRLPFIPDSPRMPEVPEAPVVPEVPSVTPPSPPSPPGFHRETLGQRIGSFFGRTMTAGFLSLVFVGVGLLIVLIWPRNVRHVADCISALPLQSFGLGLLTFLIAVVLEALAAVVMILIILLAAALISTIILIPAGLLLILLSVLVLLPVPLALAGGMVLGWVGLAEMVGQRVLKVLNVRDVRPLGAVLAGLLVTVPLAALLWVLRPLCCAWPFIVLLTSVGLGAVIHTRFGTQSCRESGPDAQFEALPAEAMDEEAGYPDAPSGNYP
jgi:cytoskeletal protein CcmA (bactofilin family)